jgi:hypothetical protein
MEYIWGEKVKKICALMLALILLFSMATSAAALEYKAIARQSGTCALAGWTDMDEDTINSTDLVAIKTPVGTFVFLSVSTFDTMTGNGSYNRDTHLPGIMFSMQPGTLILHDFLQLISKSLTWKVTKRKL